MEEEEEEAECAFSLPRGARQVQQGKRGGTQNSSRLEEEDNTNGSVEQGESVGGGKEGEEGVTIFREGIG